MNFTEKLKHAVSSSGSTLCVGLDPVPERIPVSLKEEFPNQKKQIFEFCRRIVEATKKDACAFKPNTAFFEALGSDGWNILEDVCEVIPSNRILIVDAKRGDIGNTAERYKTAFFDNLNADAVTLNGLMGFDTLEPFLGEADKAIYLLVMTSNRGASEFLQRRFEGRMSLGEYMAGELSKKQKYSAAHLGMVVGATQAGWAEAVFNANRNAHLLIPGLGKQGGTVKSLEEMLKPHKGIPVFNSSRSIIYAGGDSDNWIEKVSEKAVEMKQSLKKITSLYV